MQVLEKRAEAATQRHFDTLENMDVLSHADWDQLYVDGRSSQMATWGRNEFHRLQHQTAKSILGST